MVIKYQSDAATMPACHDDEAGPSSNNFLTNPIRVPLFQSIRLPLCDTDLAAAGIRVGGGRFSLPVVVQVYSARSPEGILALSLADTSLSMFI